jgi:hypothetical protein
LTIVGVFVVRAARGITRTGFLRITVAAACTADGPIRGETAPVGTTVFVARVALSITTELAGRSVTTAVVATAVFTTTVTILAALDNAVATLTTHDGIDISVVCQTVDFGVQAQSSANVANAAW